MTLIAGEGLVITRMKCLLHTKAWLRHNHRVLDLIENRKILLESGASVDIFERAVHPRKHM